MAILAFRLESGIRAPRNSDAARRGLAQISGGRAYDWWKEHLRSAEQRSAVEAVEAARAKGAPPAHAKTDPCLRPFLECLTFGRCDIRNAFRARTSISPRCSMRNMARGVRKKRCMAQGGESGWTARTLYPDSSLFLGIRGTTRHREMYAENEGRTLGAGHTSKTY